MIQELDLQQYIQPIISQKSLAIPIDFQFPAIDMLCKQLTKLNSQHKYRMHYLGPRFINTQIMHKKYSTNYNQPNLNLPLAENIPKYQISMRNIVQSFYMNEKLRKNTFYKNNIFYRAFQGMNPTLPSQNQYVFDSIFQSGNLDCAIKVKQNQFDLFLRIDSNTKGHMNWFYFSIKNGNKKQKIKLNICNLKKRNTLYEKGMIPYIFSKKKYQKFKQQWKQQGKNIKMVKKELRYKFLYEKLKVPILYTLSLQYQFEQENDEVFFAYCIPYTYSQMIHFVYSLQEKYTKIHSLGSSLSGLKIPLLHITDFESKNQKKTIMITGRVHPCQSNSSHVLQGFLKLLCSEQKFAEQLRKRVDFIIVPMINPDGVVLGNSRTGLMGKDLNRQFSNPKQTLFPQVCLIKNFVQKLQLDYNITTYLDFHGHSCRKNTFFFGPPYIISQHQYYKARVLPRLIQKINNSFRFYSCSYIISQNKKNTARAVMFQHFKIPYVYTVQSSIGYYYNSQTRQTFPFCQKAWNKMGQSICQALSNFFIALTEYEQFLKQKKILRQMKKQKQIQRQRELQKRRERERTKKEQKQKQKQKQREKQKQKQKQKQLSNNYQKKFKNDRNSSNQKRDDKRILFSPELQRKNSNELHFVQLLQQVKQIEQKKIKQQYDQISLSSDDHDNQQDLQPKKIQQLNNLVVQSINARVQQNNKNNFMSIQHFSNSNQHCIKKQKRKGSLNNQNYYQDQLDIFNKIKQKPKSVYLQKQCQYQHLYHNHNLNDHQELKTVAVFHQINKNSKNQDLLQDDQQIFRTHRKIIKGFRLQKKKIKQSSRQIINKIIQRQRSSREQSQQKQKTFYDCCFINSDDIHKNTIDAFRLNRKNKKLQNNFNTINNRSLLNKEPTKMNLTFTQYVQGKQRSNSLYKKVKPQNSPSLKNQSDFYLGCQDHMPSLKITSRMTKYNSIEDKKGNTSKQNQSLPSSFYAIKQNLVVKRNKFSSLAHKSKTQRQDFKESFNITIRSFMK